MEQPQTNATTAGQQATQDNTPDVTSLLPEAANLSAEELIATIDKHFTWQKQIQALGEEFSVNLLVPVDKNGNPIAALATNTINIKPEAADRLYAIFKEMLKDEDINNPEFQSSDQNPDFKRAVVENIINDIFIYPLLEPELFRITLGLIFETINNIKNKSLKEFIDEQKNDLDAEIKEIESSNKSTEEKTKAINDAKTLSKTAVFGLFIIQKILNPLKEGIKQYGTWLISAPFNIAKILTLLIGFNTVNSLFLTSSFFYALPASIAVVLVSGIAFSILSFFAWQAQRAEFEVLAENTIQWGETIKAKDTDQSILSKLTLSFKRNVITQLSERLSPSTVKTITTATAGGLVFGFAYSYQTAMLATFLPVAISLIAIGTIATMISIAQQHKIFLQETQHRMEEASRRINNPSLAEKLAYKTAPHFEGRILGDLTEQEQRLEREHNYQQRLDSYLTSLRSVQDAEIAAFKQQIRSSDLEESFIEITGNAISKLKKATELLHARQAIDGLQSRFGAINFRNAIGNSPISKIITSCISSDGLLGNTDKPQLKAPLSEGQQKVVASLIALLERLRATPAPTVVMTHLRAARESRARTASEEAASGYQATTAATKAKPTPSASFG